MAEVVLVLVSHPHRLESSPNIHGSIWKQLGTDRSRQRRCGGERKAWRRMSRRIWLKRVVKVQIEKFVLPVPRSPLAVFV